MLENQPSQQIKCPTKQHIVNWIEEANSKLNSNVCIVKKVFQVTGQSNALGGHEHALIRDDALRNEIEEILGEVFGEGNMGYQPEEEADNDPFSSNSEDGGSKDEESIDYCHSGTSSDSCYCRPDYEHLSD